MKNGRERCRIMVLLIAGFLSSGALAASSIDCPSHTWSVHIGTDDQVTKSSVLTALDLLGSHSAIQLKGLTSDAEGRSLFVTIDVKSMAEGEAFEKELIDRLNRLKGIRVSCLPDAGPPGGITGSN